MRACWSRAAVLPVPCDWAALLGRAGSCPCSLPPSPAGMLPSVVSGFLPPGSVGLGLTQLSCAVGYPGKVYQRCILPMKTFLVLWSVTPRRIPHLRIRGTMSRLQKLTDCLLPLTFVMFSFCISALQSYILYYFLYSSCLKANWHVLFFLTKIKKL